MVGAQSRLAQIVTNLSPRQRPSSPAVGTWALGKCKPVLDFYSRKRISGTSAEEEAGRELWEDCRVHPNQMLQARVIHTDKLRRK